MIASHIREILIVTGVLTMSSVALFLMPVQMLRLVFGVQDPDLATRTITRHWGVLLVLVGALLVFAGYHPEVRVPVMVVGAIEKLIIGALVFASSLRQRKLLVAIVLADAVMAILYLIALL